MVNKIASLRSVKYNMTKVKSELIRFNQFSNKLLNQKFKNKHDPKLLGILIYLTNVSILKNVNHRIFNF